MKSLRHTRHVLWPVVHIEMHDCRSFWVEQLLLLRLLFIVLVFSQLLHFLNEEAVLDEEEKETTEQDEPTEEVFIVFGERNKFIENEFLLKTKLIYSMAQSSPDSRILLFFY